MKPLHVLSLVVILMTPCAFAQEQDTGNALPLFAVEQQTATQDTSRPPADVVRVDSDPMIVERKEPVYPEAAINANLEGEVWVKAWVDRQGRVRDVQILKSDSEIFNKSVIEAARGFRFKPALVKDKPVDVWVTLPFKFRLAEKPSSVDHKRYDELSQFVRDVLECKAVDSTRIRALVFPEAYVAIGGEYIHLIDAIRSQAGAHKILEQPNRKITFTKYDMNMNGDASFMTVKTEGKGRNSKPRFHTLVMFSNAKGEWVIQEWNCSQ
jgi:TonB family protein